MIQKTLKRIFKISKCLRREASKKVIFLIFCKAEIEKFRIVALVDFYSFEKLLISCQGPFKYVKCVDFTIILENSVYKETLPCDLLYMKKKSNFPFFFTRQLSVGGRDPRDFHAHIMGVGESYKLI